jgi:hypothetical protein
MMTPKSESGQALQRSMLFFALLEDAFMQTGKPALAKACKLHKDLCALSLPNSAKMTRTEWAEYLKEHSLIDQPNAKGGTDAPK